MLDELKTFLKGETFPVDQKSQNSSTDAFARTPQTCVHGSQHTLNCFMCNKQSQLDGVLQNIDTVDESCKLSRRTKRRINRQQIRLSKRLERSNEIGSIEQIFNYHDLFKAGKRCCNTVRWKHSVQNFEMRLFSGTAARRRAILTGKYKFSPYVFFYLSERGKTRLIAAPRIQDRQVEKLFTQKVLLPLYLPHIIHNNGACLQYKGFQFSKQLLIRNLHRHFRKYGRAGGIILADAKKFFPNANHQYIRERHNKFIFNDDLKQFGNAVLDTVPKGIGMPLGVELSQIEMLSYPSKMDNYMTAQCGLVYGHYMDDFYILVPPDKDYKQILAIFKEQAKQNHIMINDSKTRYVPLTKPFRYCKAKYILTETGKIIVRANKFTMPRNRRKIKFLYNMWKNGKISLEDVRLSINGMLAYLAKYSEHNHTLELRRLFFSLFKFSCEDLKNFRTENKSVITMETEQKIKQLELTEIEKQEITSLKNQHKTFVYDINKTIKEKK